MGDSTNIKKDVKREVKYLNKDFSQFRNSLVEHAKTYFPTTYTDFSDSSIGMMFVEMASYVGDVLSYYVDNTFKETILAYAEETKTVYDIAQSLGYKPKTGVAASCKVDVYCTVPAQGSGANVIPNWSYAPTVEGGMRLSTAESVTTFRTTEPINFQVSSSIDPTYFEKYQESTDGTPTKFLLKKKVDAVSGDVSTEYLTYGTAEQYTVSVLSRENINEIISVSDSDGNKWYEVMSLGQDTILDESVNNSTNSPDVSDYAGDTPYLMKLIRTPRRFVTYLRDDNRMEIRFGSGISDNPDEEIIPNPDSVGSSLSTGVSKLDSTFDPTNFLKTRTYGLAPSGTTLTFTYAHGASQLDNVGSKQLTRITNKSASIPNSSTLNSSTVSDTLNSVRAINTEAAVGARNIETLNEIKSNAAANFQSQNRAVTKNDYMVRSLAMPSRFGSIAKVYVVQDDHLSDIAEKTSDNNGADSNTTNDETQGGTDQKKTYG
jgi:hypothetical protein